MKIKTLSFIILIFNLSCDENREEKDYILNSYKKIENNLDCIDLFNGVTIITRGHNKPYYSIAKKDSCFTTYSLKNDTLYQSPNSPPCFTYKNDENLINLVNCFDRMGASSLKARNDKNISITVHKNITFIRLEELPKYKVYQIGKDGWYWYYNKK